MTEAAACASVSSVPRCPACHEALLAEQPALTCPDGHAAIHADGIELTPTCPLLGCSASLASAEPQGARSLALSPEQVAEAGRLQALGRELLQGGLSELEAGEQERAGAATLIILLILSGLFALVGQIFEASRGAPWPLTALEVAGLLAAVALLPPLYRWLSRLPGSKPSRPAWGESAPGPRAAFALRRRWWSERARLPELEARELDALVYGCSRDGRISAAAAQRAGELLVAAEERGADG